jgi:pyridoxine kinase
MRHYIHFADLITPNLTEAAILLHEPYKPDMPTTELKDWIFRLADQGPEMIIITSVPVRQPKNHTAVIAYERNNGRFWKISCKYIPANFPGTGDAFTSVVIGSLLQGDSLPVALDRAVQFVSTAIHATFGHRSPEKEGLLLERVLQNLRAPLSASGYEVL